MSSFHPPKMGGHYILEHLFQKGEIEIVQISRRMLSHSTLPHIIKQLGMGETAVSTQTYPIAESLPLRVQAL